MDIRNVAIIAHVDHGKTTLVDCLLKQSGTFRENQQVAERAMDSNDLERERGITILAKATSVVWKGTRVNIVDTPGHADFGGEVERILSMVDGVVLLVDAAEGPLPQTKFVLGKALRLGLRPIVLINKVDRSDARPHQVHDEVFDLFSALEANDQQLDFPTLFASARQGWAATSLEAEHKDMEPLFDLILRHVPPPHIEADKPFRMLVTTLESDPFLGRILTGRIHSGAIKPNTVLKSLSRDGSEIEQTRVTKVLAFRGLERVALDSAEAGDIVAVAGFKNATVADTICDQDVEWALPGQPVDPPTLAMTFSVNDSPLAGREGDSCVRHTLDRLQHLARDLRMPVLLLHHVRKPQASDWSKGFDFDRLRGSSALAQVSVSIIGVDALDRGSEHRRVSAGKATLAPLPPPLGFRIEGRADLGEHCRLVFGPPPRMHERLSRLEEAQDFLRHALAHGPRPAGELKREATAAGVAAGTLRLARERVCVPERELGRKGRWLWALRPATSEQPHTQDTQH